MSEKKHPNIPIVSEEPHAALYKTDLTILIVRFKHPVLIGADTVETWTVTRSHGATAHMDTAGIYFDTKKEFEDIIPWENIASFRVVRK
jgi:hypothetical protein